VLGRNARPEPPETVATAVFEEPTDGHANERHATDDFDELASIDS
jgi:hypothetical protein